MTVKHRIHACLLGAVMTLPLGVVSALAQEAPPPDRAGEPPPPRDGDVDSARARGDRDGRPDRDPRFDRTRLNRPLQLPTDEEWTATQQFMSEHAPNMARRIEQAKNLTTMVQERLKSRTFSEYRSIRDLEKDNPELYQIRLKALTTRDNLFALVDELRDSSDDKATDLRQTARDLVKQLVDLGFDEREMRIKDLDKRVAGERSALDKDRARSDEMIDKRMKDELRRGGRGPDDESSSPDGPPRRDPQRMHEEHLTDLERAMRDRRDREQQRVSTSQPATKP